MKVKSNAIMKNLNKDALFKLEECGGNSKADEETER